MEKQGPDVEHEYMRPTQCGHRQDSSFQGLPGDCVSVELNLAMRVHTEPTPVKGLPSVGKLGGGIGGRSSVVEDEGGMRGPFLQDNCF